MNSEDDYVASVANVRKDLIGREMVGMIVYIVLERVV